MGQLEKYGLYVLCLVIFLILGVAIWGGDPTLPQQAPKETTKLALPEGGKGKEQPKEQTKEQPKEPAKPVAGGDSAKPQNREPQGKDPQSKDSQGKELEGFFTPVPSKTDKKDPAADKAHPAASPKANDAKPADPKVAAEQQKPRTYLVQDHDTLSKIAERELGSRGRVADIEALNPQIHKGLIHKGDQIKLPAPKPAAGADAAKKTDDKTDKVASADKPARGKNYKVQSGDTLTSISRAAYGSDKHVKEIWAANKAKLANANKLPNNLTLLLP